MPISVTLLGIVTDRNAVEEKQAFPKEVTLLGISIPSSKLQPTNALSSIFVTLDGISTFSNLEHFSKVLFCITVIVLGSVTVRKPEYLKASSSMFNVFYTIRNNYRL